MIMRICCYCNVVLGPPINDGKEITSISHGACPPCGEKAMAAIESQFAELPADLTREVTA